MSSAWNHSMCNPCWARINPGQSPVRLLHASWDVCCWCGEITHSGIYVRIDPKDMLCQGIHPPREP